MERTIIGLVAGAALVMLATSTFSAPQAAVGHYGQAASGENELVAFTSQLQNGRSQLTLVDTKSRVVAVYHIEPVSGELSLKSVRTIRWDLQMTQFNAVSPLPQEIRSLVERR